MKKSLVIAAFLAALSAAAAAGAPPIPIAAASAVFARAHALCSADGGRLWGISLCGPIMLANPQTRAAVANVRVPNSQSTGAYYRFTLPANAQVSNTTIEYAGIAWAQIMWPLTGTADEQAVELMHESFHRVQPKLGFVVKGAGTAATISGSPALDTEAGRIWLRGEMHALRTALTSSGVARRKALADALALRAYRDRILPSTVTPEHVLDVIEGLAESTGIDAGLPPARRIGYALKDMSRVEAAPSLAREFPYAVGPAYSELLDAARPHWRRSVTMATSIAALAARAYAIPIAAPAPARARAIVAKYGGAAIEREEAVRAAQVAARDAKYRGELVAGRTLRLPMEDFKINFRPQEVEQFGRYGSVYHHVTVSAPWGTIVVAGGDALIAGDFSQLTVGAPSSLSGSTLRGTGFVLTLNAGSKIVPDPKKPGSYTVTNP